jgi:hypothetical protein
MSKLGNLCSTAIAGIDEAKVTQALQIVLIDINALALCVGGIRATTVWSFIPVEAEPMQIGEHTLCSSRTYARAVEVLDAQHKASVIAPYEKPGKESCAQVAQV